VTVIVLATAAAIVAAAIAAGLGRGGELAQFPRAAAAFDPEVGTAADVALVRPPVSLLGYDMAATDSALAKIARVMSEQNVEIELLRGRLIELQQQVIDRTGGPPGDFAPPASRGSAGPSPVTGAGRAAAARPPGLRHRPWGGLAGGDPQAETELPDEIERPGGTQPPDETELAGEPGGRDGPDAGDSPAGEGAAARSGPWPAPLMPPVSRHRPAPPLPTRAPRLPREDQQTQASDPVRPPVRSPPGRSLPGDSAPGNSPPGNSLPGMSQPGRTGPLPAAEPAAGAPWPAWRRPPWRDRGPHP
jgi:hypothetical protein